MTPDDDIILSDDELERLLSQGIEELPDDVEPSPISHSEPEEASFASGSDGGAMMSYGVAPETVDEIFEQGEDELFLHDAPASPPVPPATRERQSSAGQTQSRGETVRVQPAQFSPLPGTSAAPRVSSGDLAMLYNVPLQLAVELGRTRMSVREVLEMGPGAVIELERSAGDLVDILVNGVLFAQGEVVVVDEQFGVRITRLLGREDEGSVSGLPLKKGR